MSTMLLVPLEDIVVFPNMNVTLTVDVGDEERVLLVPFHDNDYASVGTVAEVTDRVRLPGGGRAVALNGLTPRETDVFALVVTGLLSKQIAAQLRTSEATVKAHRAQLMRKMEADSVAQLVRIAKGLSLLPPRR